MRASVLRPWLALVLVSCLTFGGGLRAPAAPAAPAPPRDVRFELFPPPPPEPPPAPAPTPAPTPPPDESGGQPCFGAAAADREHPCDNPGLDDRVVPDPARARSAQHYETCTQTEYTRLFKVCYWGAPADQATRVIALVGDSHASHWRAAMQAVVTARRWRGVSIQRAGCPLTAAHPDLPGAARQQGCMAWNQGVQRWIARHPEIDTIFTSAHRGNVIPDRGETMQTARRAGFTAAFLRLLRAGVRHVVVIRDTPRISSATIPCLERALATRSAPVDEACDLPRGYALRPDPAVEAADRLALPQVQVADLHAFMCGATVCHPVVGGVLVLRDVSHMTTTFSATLGPYLLQTVDQLSAGWAPSAARGS